MSILFVLNNFVSKLMTTKFGDIMSVCFEGSLLDDTSVYAYIYSIVTE